MVRKRILGITIYSYTQIAEELKRKKVAIKVIDQNIDTNDATGRLLFNMLGAISQFETEIRAERQMDGI
ncbi:recombinase family protein, partial [Pseudomonadota bacterium]